MDHYYWILAARAYRDRSGLPAVIKDKYLLEDERQYYPPGFGVFLALFPEAFLKNKVSVSIVCLLDLIAFWVILSAANTMALTLPSLAAIALLFGTAPVLVSYNTQLTSRVLGNLFLTFSLLAQAGAASVDSAFLAWLLAFLGAIAFGLTISTHKMCTQFGLALWPVWPFALMPLGPNGFWVGLLTAPVGLLFSTLITGSKFQIMQWRAHWDILSFWSRNWPFLGAHQFRQSPIYGNPQKVTGRLHKKGVKGASRHLLRIISYLPLALPLPITLSFLPPPPLYIMAWLGMAYLLAFATCLIPALRGLGAGHLYIYSAVPPAALWWGWVLSRESCSWVEWGLFALGTVLTSVSLFSGYRMRKTRKISSGRDEEATIRFLGSMSKTRIAVFPFTLAERFAYETPHAVFWGGHGLGFKQLEPYWPIMRETIRKSLLKWGIRFVILDSNWWKKGEKIFCDETGDCAPMNIGRFILYQIKP